MSTTYGASVEPSPDSNVISGFNDITGRKLVIVYPDKEAVIDPELFILYA